MQSITAHIIVLGQEILAGVTLDTNSGYIARCLRGMGIETTQISTIPDDIIDIKKHLALAEKNVDLIITTGGLGPTKDDKTKTAFAEYFNQELVHHKAVFQHLKSYLEVKGRPELLAKNLEQALIPPNARPLLNYMGTAPGLCFRERGKLFFMLPGVPYEMKHLLNTKVVPMIQETFRPLVIKTKTLFVSGIPESLLSHRLEEWENSLSGDFSLSYLPENSIVKLRLSLSGSQEEEVLSRLEAEMKKVKELISGHYFETDLETREAIIHFHLNRLGWSLSTAESYTGGLLVNRLLQEKGSSAVISGGACVYQTSAKEQVLGLDPEILEKHPVVSAEVAEVMAKKGAELYHSEVCISTTGCAGPDRDEDGTEVGKAYFSIRFPGHSVTKELYFPGLEREDFVKFSINRIFQELITHLEKM